MRTQPGAPRSSVAIADRTIVIVGVIVIVLAAVVAGELATSRSTSTTTVLVPITALAKQLDENGTYVTNASIKVGEEMKASITVPSGTDPISLHMVLNGTAFPEHGWIVNATGYTYIADSGPANNINVGVSTIYAVVTFQDGSTVQSNNVILTVTK